MTHHIAAVMYDPTGNHEARIIDDEVQREDWIAQQEQLHPFASCAEADVIVLDTATLGTNQALYVNMNHTAALLVGQDRNDVEVAYSRWLNSHGFDPRLMEDDEWLLRAWIHVELTEQVLADRD